MLPRAKEGLGLEVSSARKDVIGCCIVNIRMVFGIRGSCLDSNPICSPGCRDCKSRMESKRIVVLWLKLKGNKPPKLAYP